MKPFPVISDNKLDKCSVSQFSMNYLDIVTYIDKTNVQKEILDYV